MQFNSKVFPVVSLFIYKFPRPFQCIGAQGDLCLLPRPSHHGLGATLLCQVASVLSSSVRPLWTIACQAALSIRFSRQQYCSGLPRLSPRDLPDLGTESVSVRSPALAGRFITTRATYGIPLFIQKFLLETYLRHRVLCYRALKQFCFLKTASLFFKGASSPSVIHLSFQSPNPEITAQTPEKEFWPRHFCIRDCVLSDFFIFWSLCPKVLST